MSSSRAMAAVCIVASRRPIARGKELIVLCEGDRTFRTVNLEFNAHFLDTALDHACDIVECPITFHPRVGVSKGGNVKNRRALCV